MCMEFFGISAPIMGFGVIAAAFALFAALELARPFRKFPLGRLPRWRTNLGLYAIDTLAVRLVLPLAMVGAAVWARDAGWGLFNVTQLPPWAEFIAAIVLLDLALYIQHRATHEIPLLWRLHKVHHTDTGFDITTGARFHPAEIVLSMAYKMAIVVALGAAPLAVFVFEIGFAVATIFTHGNFRLPSGLEAAWRRLFVTPDMHRIHHSAMMDETNSNYGTVLSGWDRLLGTYVGAAKKGQNGLIIGLESYQDERPGRLGWSLRLPFARRRPGEE